MKRLFGTLLGLLVVGLSSAHGQFGMPFGTPFYNRPVTNPLQTPFFNPYSPFTPNYGYYGNPAARPPGSLQGVPGMNNPGLTSVTGVQSLGDPSMTGHPTRFFDYSRYFFNQGGMTVTSTGLPASQSPTQQAGQAAAAIGSSPLRGRSSTSGTSK